VQGSGVRVYLRGDISEEVLQLPRQDLASFGVVDIQQIAISE
jgi:hypothetical protein